LQGDLSFRLMTLEYRLRDLGRPPERMLREIGLRCGMTALDFGCGPGSFSLAAARLVGPTGHVVAVDIQPLAIRRLRRAAARRGFNHLQVIHRDDLQGVPSESADVALLLDVLHEMDEPDAALAEVGRVLKQGGILCARDHCMKRAGLLQSLTENGQFRLAGESGELLRFELAEPDARAT